MNEQRLIDLESKFSYQEALIEELRQTAHNQYLALQELERKLKVITDQFKTSVKEVDNASHERPPHY